MKLVDKIHSDYVHGRRVEKLSQYLGELIPLNARVLDVGCGDGLLAHLIANERPDIKINGVDVLIREKTYFTIDKFDGRTLPYADNAFEVVMFTDVLHHTDDPMILLKEAKRVSSNSIVLKDHTQDGFLDGPTLRFMDYIGNAKHGVSLPYNYWTEKQWHDAITELDLKIDKWKHNLKLYNSFANFFFGRKLHFVAKFEA